MSQELGLLMGNLFRSDVEVSSQAVGADNRFHQEFMMRHLYAAENSYQTHHRSRFWDIFGPEFRELIERPDIWRSFRRTGITHGLETGLLMSERRIGKPGELIVERDYSRESERSDLLDRFDRLIAMCGREFFVTVSECDIGDPQYLQHDGARLNFDDLYHVYYAWQVNRLSKLLSFEPRHILEIGGGYGNLAAKLKRLFPQARYTILDLPETLVVQSYYLRGALPEARMIGCEDLETDPVGVLTAGDYDVALLPGWFAEGIPSDSVDLVINMRSMMEMIRTVIENYFVMIQRAITVGGWFYCVNRYEKDVVGEPIRLKDYPFDSRWEALLSQPAWLQTHIHEYILRRTTKPPEVPLVFLLASLPDRSPPAP